ncbi:MAG: hypothetical protein CM15mP74_09960 [Halieaceae bacterium]|nr:MAG: hypothetical protein CM15mP74_09960 [Halieaceae bacterium]
MTHLTRDDLWSLEEYATRRADFRAEVMAHKRIASWRSANTRDFTLKTQRPFATRYKKCCALNEYLKLRGLRRN